MSIQQIIDKLGPTQPQTNLDQTVLRLAHIVEELEMTVQDLESEVQELRDSIE